MTLTLDFQGQIFKVAVSQERQIWLKQKGSISIGGCVSNVTLAFDHTHGLSKSIF